MDVREAVATRFSCRAFLPDPVPEAVVRDIVERSARAPSGGNLQPWRVHALAGSRLEALREQLRPRMNELPRAEGSEYEVYPLGLKEPYRSRRHEVGELLYRSIDIPRQDRAGRYRQYARNFELFGAPVGLFITVDRQMGPPQWADLGMFVQTIMVVARAHDLDTCAQEAWAFWHKTLATFLPIPTDHMIFCGIALGRADRNAPINQWRSPRAALDDFASFEGFDGAASAPAAAALDGAAASEAKIA